MFVLTLTVNKITASVSGVDISQDCSHGDRVLFDFDSRRVVPGLIQFDSRRVVPGLIQFDSRRVVPGLIQFDSRRVVPGLIQFETTL